MARAPIRPVSFAALLACLCLVAAPAQQRALSSLYPGFAQAIPAGAASAGGISDSGSSPGELGLLPAGEVGAALLKALEGRRYSFLGETLSILPRKVIQSPALRDKLALYNAISQVRSLSGITYRSSSQGQRVLFDEVTRVADASGGRILPDTTEADLATRSGFFVRLKDANFGTSYYRMDFDTSFPGILMAMSNARPLQAFMMTVLGEGEMFSYFYIEPTQGGLVIYSLSGAKVEGFAARQVDLPSALRKRATALKAWLIDRMEG